MTADAHVLRLVRDIRRDTAALTDAELRANALASIAEMLKRHGRRSVTIWLAGMVARLAGGQVEPVDLAPRTGGDQSTRN